MTEENKLDKIHEDIVDLQIERGIKTVEDLSFGDLEFPFIYKGMLIRDYWIERVYYAKHLDDVHNLTYKPLWQQRGEKRERLII